MRDFIAYQIAMQAARSLGGCLGVIRKKDRDLDLAVAWGYLAEAEAGSARELLDRLLAISWRLTEGRGAGKGAARR